MRQQLAGAFGADIGRQQLHIGALCQQFFDIVAIFLVGDGAGGIDEAAARLQAVAGRQQQLVGKLGQNSDVGTLFAPAGIGAGGQHAQARARSIQQHAVGLTSKAGRQRGGIRHLGGDTAKLHTLGIFADQLHLMRVDIEAREHTVTFTSEGSVPQITADRERIEQVIVNVLSNSVKYTPVGGKIDVTVRSEENNVSFCVKDNGIDIPEEDLDRIFERFYRVEKSRTSEMGGTGLGLAIARELIEAHGGDIQIDSRLGEGTAVTVTLPIVCNPA